MIAQPTKPEMQELLAKAALELENAAPEPWNHFLTILNVHRENCDDRLAEAPADQIHKVQGHAQQVRWLLAKLMGARALLRQIEEKRQKAKVLG